MKKILVVFINWLVTVFSFFISYERSRKLKYFSNRIYTQWIQRSFSQTGAGMMLEKPVYLIGAKHIKIGENFFANSRLRIECWSNFEIYRYNPELIIGNNVSFNYNCHIGCINKIVIGDNVLFASNVFITDHFHGSTRTLDLCAAPAKRQLHSKGAVIIENNVWIGENVVIMPDVTIGENSIIGANAVVTKSFPKNSVVAGVPATLVKTFEFTDK